MKDVSPVRKHKCDPLRDTAFEMLDNQNRIAAISQCVIIHLSVLVFGIVVVVVIIMPQDCLLLPSRDF